MKIYILILRNKNIFKIFVILMFVGVIFDSNFNNSANHTFADYDYRGVVNQNNSLASLISKNSQIYENRSIKIEKDYEKEFDWPLYGNISILMSQLESGENPSIAALRNHEHSYLIDNKNSCIFDIFGLFVLLDARKEEGIREALKK